MLQAVPLLAETPEIQPIVQSCIAHKVMPKDPSGDALHLAIASFYACEFLVTWNCIHLANPLKERAYSPHQRPAGFVPADHDNTDEPVGRTI